MITSCPNCHGTLQISAFTCPDCAVEMRGRFGKDEFASLQREDRAFALVFLQCGGRIGMVEKLLGISYPTVKARLHRVIELLGGTVDEGEERTPGGHHDSYLGSTPTELLEQLQRGRIRPEEAIEQLSKQRRKP